MALEWTPDLAVGHEEIDRQHRELFEQVNRILAAMEEGRGRDEVERTLGFLSDYLVAHFKAEERQMALHGYRAITAHVAEHGAFVKQVLALRDRFRAGGATMELALELQRLVCGLLADHFLKADQALAGFLRRQR